MNEDDELSMVPTETILKTLEHARPSDADPVKLRRIMQQAAGIIRNYDRAYRRLTESAVATQTENTDLKAEIARLLSENLTLQASLQTAHSTADKPTMKRR